MEDNDQTVAEQQTKRTRLTSLINRALVKKMVHKYGKRVSPGFLKALELHVYVMVEAACKQHNGGAKTLDREVAAYVGIKV